MKNIILAIFSLSCFLLYGKFDETLQKDAGNFTINITNYGVKKDFVYPKLNDNEQNLACCNYVRFNAMWCGAKKYRRNELGEKLYWLPGPINENDVIPASHPSWSPDLQVVVDTLTSIGFDGDAELYELLPAYNPLEANEVDIPFAEFNLLDRVLKTSFGLRNYDEDNDGLIDEDDLGSPFDLGNDNFCFTIPFDDDFDGLFDEDISTPGIESTISYCYDYSPFSNGYDGDRDWGSGKENNTHIPLQIAIKQQSFAYPTIPFSDIFFLTHTIYNASSIDTLFDFCYGHFVNLDIQSFQNPVYSPTELGYYEDENCCFLFAKKEVEEQEKWIGWKILGRNDLNFSAWNWNSGHGPDDSAPLDVNPSGSTANEKYWLMTGRNPQESSFTNLMLEDQESQGDTRFLYSIYGDQNGFDEPSDFSINIPPNSEISFYSVIFFASHIDDLKEISILATDFYESDFDESLMEGLPSFPVLHHVEVVETSVDLDWYCFTTPDQQFVYIKEDDSPASTWQEIETDTNINHYDFSDLNETIEYDFKIGVYYGDIYLESNTITAGSDVVANEEDIINSIGNKLQVFPNPFNPSTTIEFNLPEISKTKISIYNIKGQKIKELINEALSAGNHQVYWNGKDEKNKIVSSGIYFVRLESADKTEIKKIMLMK